MSISISNPGGGGGTDPGALQKSQNLADLANVVTARTNLGVATPAREILDADLSGGVFTLADADVGKVIIVHCTGASACTLWSIGSGSGVAVDRLPTRFFNRSGGNLTLTAPGNFNDGGTTYVLKPGESVAVYASSDFAVFGNTYYTVEQFGPLAPHAVNAQTGTTYTPALLDSNTLVTLSNASAITLTLPQNSDVAFPIDTYIDFMQLGAGQVTVAAGTGATVRVSGLISTAKSRAQYSRFGAHKTATNTWSVFGDLAAS